MNIGKYVSDFTDDLKFKNYSLNTIENYSSQVKLFLSEHSENFSKPSEVSADTIKRWVLKINSINGRRHRLSALKLFYKYTVKQPLKFRYIEYPKQDKKLPVVLSVDEINSMLSVCNNIKHKVIFLLLYSCGFRISELLNLKWAHLDRSRKVINIIAGKGKKDRQVPFPELLIPILENYYKQYRTSVYVVEGIQGGRYSEKSVNNVLQQLSEKSGIKKKVHAHLIRHCYATHLLEKGLDIKKIQLLLGHNSSKTTEVYLHIGHNITSKLGSPIDNLTL